MRSEELRIAKTESRFREVNERIADTAERIAAPLEEYEKTRADGTHFLVSPGHEEQEHERIVKTLPGFRVIQKLKGVGAVARRLNPRRAEA